MTTARDYGSRMAMDDYNASDLVRLQAKDRSMPRLGVQRVYPGEDEAKRLDAIHDTHLDRRPSDF